MREDMKSLNSTDFYIPYLGMILKDLAFYEKILNILMMVYLLILKNWKRCNMQ